MQAFSTRVAKGALEQVCPGARLSSASELYSVDFGASSGISDVPP